MSVDDYLTWAEGQPGRYELIDGVVHPMGPERWIHARVKAAIFMAFALQIRRRGLLCHPVPDGMIVRIDATTAFEPDAMVYCGEELPPLAIVVPDPVIVVEALSTSTRDNDEGRKRVGYFTLPSLQHYLIVDPHEPLVVHHVRGDGDTIVARPMRKGTITLDPPGLELTPLRISTDAEPSKGRVSRSLKRPGSIRRNPGAPVQARLSQSRSQSVIEGSSGIPGSCRARGQAGSRCHR